MANNAIYFDEKEIERAFKRLTKQSATTLDPLLSPRLCRNKNIKQFRTNGDIFIGKDRRKNKTIVFLPEKKVVELGFFKGKTRFKIE